MKKREDKSWMMFLDLCLEVKSRLLLEELFSLFFTIEEKVHLASRVGIVKALLEAELSQREISDKRKVSISQITRGSNALKIVSHDLYKFLEGHIKGAKKNGK